MNHIHKVAQELFLASATSQLIDKKISPIAGYEFDFFIDQLSVAFAKFQFLSYFVYILWFIVGGSWGLMNLYCIKQVLYELLIAKPQSSLKIALFVFIKFPVLYGVGFGLLYYQNNASWAWLAGFSVALILCTQKRVWKAFQPKEMA